MPVDLKIPELGSKFQDYRQDIPGDSFDWGPVIDASKVKYLTYHHSVTEQTAKKDGNWKAECDKIANEHISPPNNWGGVGYRIIICSDGTVAYVGDLSHGGSAVQGNNDIMFSVCLVGDFTKELPTAAQIHSAYLLQKFFREKMPQYPLINSADSIIGHQDAYALLHLPNSAPTACPGPTWRLTSGLRDRILNDLFQGYPDPQPTPTQVPPVPAPPAPVPPQPPTIDWQEKYNQEHADFEAYKLQFNQQRQDNAVKAAVDPLQIKINLAQGDLTKVQKDLS